MPELIQNPGRKGFFLKGSNYLTIRKISIWVKLFASTKQGIWSEYQFPVRSGFSFLNFCGDFSLPLFQNVLQCPGACPALERFFNHSFMKYVKIAVKAENSHICDLEKGWKYYYTQERYSFRW